jgi:hypothetical protein
VKYLIDAALYLKRLIGNNPKASIGVGLFIALLVIALTKALPAKAAEVDLRFGSSIATGYGPVLGLSVYQPLQLGLDVYGGTLLWGSTAKTTSNWSWFGGLRGCRGQLCASLGATYLQREDYWNDSHTLFDLELSWRPGFGRFAGLDLVHHSDAGTSQTNRGRNAPLVSIRLQ